MDNRLIVRTSMVDWEDYLTRLAGLRLSFLVRELHEADESRIRSTLLQLGYGDADLRYNAGDRLLLVAGSEKLPRIELPR